MVEIAQRKTNEMFEEWLAELRNSQPLETLTDTDAKVAIDDREMADRPSGYDQPLSFEKIKQPTGDWMKLNESHGETYGWPDGSVDTYDPFVTYVGSGGWITRVTLGL